MATPILGVQTPRIESVPAYKSSAGEEALEFCAKIGMKLDPWQQYVLTRSLGERADGKWAAFETGLVVPRQNGKGTVLEARELAGLFLFNERLILHSAHEFKTSQEAFRRVLYHIETNPALQKRIKPRGIRTSHGEEGIELKNGNRLRFVARSTGSGRGFTGDLVILDEAYNLGSDGMAALLPTLSARPNPQIWYTSSAGMPTSDQLRNVRQRGIAGTSPRLAYFEWSVERGADLDDLQTWAIANPALGIRVDEEFVQSERDALDDLAFERERCGVWFDPDAERMITAEDWAKLADPRSSVLDPVVFGVDANPERTAAAISVAGRREDGLGHVELADARKGTGWVVPRLVELAASWKPVSILLDPSSAAGSFLPALQEAGIEPELVTGREMGQAVGAFVEAAVEHMSFRHRDQRELNAALSGAKSRKLSDAFAWDRRDSGVDISPLVAATLAHHGYAKHCAEPAARPWVMS